ncbi:MAG: hypothetical protein ACR2IF_17855 [Terriglobales bacterium]
MQDAMTVMVSMAALFFSLCCALLLEELMFGGLFRLLKPVRERAQRRKKQEEDLFGNLK